MSIKEIMKKKKKKTLEIVELRKIIVCQKLTNFQGSEADPKFL